MSHVFVAQTLNRSAIVSHNRRFPKTNLPHRVQHVISSGCRSRNAFSKRFSRFVPSASHVAPHLQHRPDARRYLCTRTSSINLTWTNLPPNVNRRPRHFEENGQCRSRSRSPAILDNSMQQIAQRSLLVEIFRNRQTIGVVDRDKLDRREAFPRPNRSRTQTNRTPSTHIELERRDLQQIPIHQTSRTLEHQSPHRQVHGATNVSMTVDNGRQAVITERPRTGASFHEGCFSANHLRGVSAFPSFDERQRGANFIACRFSSAK